MVYAIEQAQREVEIAEANDKLLAELAEKIKRFDDITKDALWRVGAEPLFAHQMDGAHFMASAERVLCGDDMGLGKTRQTIAAFTMREARRILIACPGDLMTNWERELNLFAPEYVTIIMGKMSYAQQLILMETFADEKDEKLVFLINYESWARNDRIIKDLQVQMLDTVVLDEAQQMKNGGSKKFKGILDLVYYPNQCTVADCNEMLLPDEYMCVNKHVTVNVRSWDEGYTQFRKDRCSIKNVMVLTGTPIMNEPADMWTLLNLINRDLFPNVNAFERMFCDVDYYTGKMTWRHGGEKQLAEKIAGVLHSPDKA